LPRLRGSTRDPPPPLIRAPPGRLTLPVEDDPPQLEPPLEPLSPEDPTDPPPDPPEVEPPPPPRDTADPVLPPPLFSRVPPP